MRFDPPAGDGLAHGRIGGAEGVPNGFTPLIEGGLDNLPEEGLVAVEMLHGIAGQSDHGALHLGRRVEDAGRHAEQVLDVVVGLQQDAQDAVLLTAGRRGEPHSHLFLDHADDLGDDLPVVQHFEKDLRGDVVRKIPDDIDAALPGVQGVEIELQEVALDDVQRRIVHAQVIDALGVDFGHGEPVAMQGQQELGQHAHTGSHFEYPGGVIGTQCFGYTPRNIQVGQKVLTEILFCSYFCHSFDPKGYRVGGYRTDCHTYAQAESPYNSSGGTAAQTPAACRRCLRRKPPHKWADRPSRQSEGCWPTDQFPASLRNLIRTSRISSSV